MIKKKEYEEYLLKKFLLSYKLIDTFPINQGETPDFIIDINSKKVSVELSRLINPDIKEREEFYNKIVEAVAEKFNNKYNEDIYVLITFSERVRVNGGQKRYNECVNEIFNLIEQTYLANKDTEFYITLKNQLLPIHYLQRLHLTNKHEFNHWQTFGAYLLDWVNIDWLKERISTKEDNIPKYKESFDENWLLLVANEGVKSSANRFDTINFSVIETAFDKVFIYQYRENETIAIK